ncbi:tRNA (adenosine(37)-N6)-threonylcarbamoyltransferase complex ATPase subunit type 1 TsaE [Algibacter mikhailovii]|uniref:tRNA (adenosine(37)-N6)-threonylcarbamoyltransferase complex ATPase subunit type 1 TsaE n=1 Tax=Algibacter mikhailovii TaxID=425498 RepID=UPI0024952402|nr:tRNA (adenosine(37)-N6)-threonylcarbamoyltransferase complex ATPase subunit type 1 TsaE [Algibacter mikhailovii]
MEISFELNEVEQIAQEIIKKVKSKTLLFYGEMGVGKTTLIKSIVKTLGCLDEVNSPTFSIVNEYKTENEGVFHFDLYRIKNIEEAYDFGIEDYLNSNNWKLIEWPEIIEDLLVDDYDKIVLKLDAKNKRILTINK